MAEAEDEIHEEKNLDEIIKEELDRAHWAAKCGVEGLTESVVAGGEQHNDVEHALPLAVLLNNKLVKKILVLGALR